MKVLIHLVVLIVYFSLSNSLSLNTTIVLDVAKDILNSFAIIEKHEPAENRAFNNKNNNSNNEEKRIKNFIKSDGNIYKAKTKNDNALDSKILNVEFLRLSNNTFKKGYNYFKKVKEIHHKTINDSLLSKNTYQGEKNKSNSSDVSIVINEVSKILEKEISNKKNEKYNNVDLNIKNKKFLNKNFSMFLEFISDLGNEQSIPEQQAARNNNNKNQTSHKNIIKKHVSKEQKRLFLLRLKNLLEKLIEIKQQKKRKNKVGFNSKSDFEKINLNKENQNHKMPDEINKEENLNQSIDLLKAADIRNESVNQFPLIISDYKIPKEIFLEILETDKDNNQNFEDAQNNEKMIEHNTNSNFNKLEKEKLIKLQSEKQPKMLKHMQDNIEKSRLSSSFEDCNKNWDYNNHGNDWNCLCKTGEKQSPINVETFSNDMKPLKENIFFDFKEPDIYQDDKKTLKQCKFPIIKNTGKFIEIDDDCGKLIMPLHSNGYKCFKITLTTPAEHKIEIKIHFQIKDKTIVDKNTKDFVILVVLVKGIVVNNAKLLDKADLKNHPFLEMLELSSLPEKAGFAKMLAHMLDYSLLFDKAKQFYKVKENIQDYNTDENIQGKGKTNNNFSLELNKAFDNLIYDKHFPLDEYYMYNGSFTYPPCEENVIYLISKSIIYAPVEQIYQLSKALISNVNWTGNYRDIKQKTNKKTKIFHFKKPEEFSETIKELNSSHMSTDKNSLLQLPKQAFSERVDKFEVKGEKQSEYKDEATDSPKEINKTEEKNDKVLDYLDNILNIENPLINKFLKIN